MNKPSKNNLNVFYEVYFRYLEFHLLMLTYTVVQGYNNINIEKRKIFYYGIYCTDVYLTMYLLFTILTIISFYSSFAIMIIIYITKNKKLKVIMYILFVLTILLFIF